MRMDILQQAQACYLALEPYRRERERNKRYHYGDQWGDVINVDGRNVTEEEFIRSQGSEPLKNNLIRRLVRNVIGVYSAKATDIKCQAPDKKDDAQARTLTALLKYNGELNRLKPLYVRSLEEFLIGGLVVHRKWYGVRDGHADCWTDYVQPSSFFIDTDMRDFRGWDCQCVGQLHDVNFAQLCQQFASSEADCARLRAIYYPPHQVTAADRLSVGLCRVLEVWRKELHPVYQCHDFANASLFTIAEKEKPWLDAENRRRKSAGKPQISATWLMQEGWRYYFLAPTGHVLAEGDSPYAHGSHPYVVKAYPLIDGEIHAFVSDVIDQQRYTNRLITLYDWIVRSSAKGVLLVPEDCIPRGCSPRQFADTWSRFNGVLLYRPSLNGDIPKQVASNSTNIGITELLNLQMKLFEDISGVNGALSGKLSNSAMSAELYDQQTQNATTALLDILDSFNEFVREAAQKDVSNIQQFYTPEQKQGLPRDFSLIINQQ